MSIHLAEEFLSWSQDPRRSIEERFGIFLLTEAVFRQLYRGEDQETFDYHRDKAAREMRCYNAAWEPELDEKKIRFTAENLATLESLDVGRDGEERPLRDLSFLRFTPNLKTLRLGGLEMDGLAPVGDLQELEALSLHTGNVESFADLARCPRLRSVSIFTSHPWPRLSGWERMASLEVLTWHGNVRVLQEVPCLPSLKQLNLSPRFVAGGRVNSLRDFHQLPELPALEVLWAEGLFRLDGIERFPKLSRLGAGGYFEDASPLTGARDLEYLRCMSDELLGLEPLARLPKLRHLAIRSLLPQDYTVLTEAPALRELVVAGCEVPQPDVDAVIASLPDNADLFGQEPVKLEPLRLFLASTRPREEAPDGFVNKPLRRDAPWANDSWKLQSENAWVEQQLMRAFDACGLIGVRGFAPGGFHPMGDKGSSSLFWHIPTDGPANILFVGLHGEEAIGRVREVIECTRAGLARVRSFWEVYLTLRVEFDEEDWEVTFGKRQRPSTSLQIRIEDENYAIEEGARRQALREKLHADELRLQILREQGHDADPGEFAPDPKLLRKPAGIETAEHPRPTTKQRISTQFRAELAKLGLEWQDLSLATFSVTEKGVWLPDERSAKVLSWLLQIHFEHVSS